MGEVSLDELFFMTYGSTLVYLIEAGLPVHPDSLDVWNVLVAERAQRLEPQADAGASQAAPDAPRSCGPRVIVIE